MHDPFVLTDLTPSPAGALELTVGCRVARVGPSTHRHPVTINPNWTVTTPHDLALERIATAMGGYLSCIELVDRIGPALGVLIQRAGRRVAPDPARTDGGRWALKAPAPGCDCNAFGYGDVIDAVEHWRSPKHVAAEFGVATRALTTLSQKIFAAHGTIFALPPDLGDAATTVREQRGVDYLWDAGLHPETVSSIHRVVWPGGPALPTWFYLGAMSRRPDLDWIASTLRQVPDEDIAVWVCWTDADLDRTHPEARTGWLQAGVPRVAIAALADGSYTPIEVARLALASGRSLQAAAIALAAWHRAGCHPTPEDIALLDELGADRWYEPSAKAIDWLCARLPSRGGPSRTEVGLVLAICGTRAAAMKPLSQGIHDPLGAARVLGFPVDRELAPQ